MREDNNWHRKVVGTMYMYARIARRFAKDKRHGRIANLGFPCNSHRFERKEWPTATGLNQRRRWLTSSTFWMIIRSIASDHFHAQMY